MHQVQGASADEDHGSWCYREVHEDDNRHRDKWHGTRPGFDCMVRRWKGSSSRRRCCTSADNIPALRSGKGIFGPPGLPQAYRLQYRFELICIIYIEVKLKNLLYMKQKIIINFEYIHSWLTTRNVKKKSARWRVFISNFQNVFFLSGSPLYNIWKIYIAHLVL
jgi:hypothetical protein